MSDHGESTPPSVTPPLVPVLILLVSDRQHTMDLIIGQTTTIAIIEVKKEDGTYLVTYTLKLRCSVTLFKTEYRNYWRLTGFRTTVPRRRQCISFK